MINGFWSQTSRPILVLAPMAGVTDSAFRRIVAKYGKPDALYTEFVSCDGLCSLGRDRLLLDLMYDESERPVVAQIFGARPENFGKTAELVRELGFDGIDINTGCPDRSVEKQGAGAALIKNPRLVTAIYNETLRGAGDLPVSIKTRLGYDRNIIDSWISHLLDLEPAAVAIHARTRNEMSKVPARWDAVADAVNIRDKRGSATLILGNGDVSSRPHAEKLAANYGVDGVMIGRGIYGNPWLFNRFVTIDQITIDKRLDVLLEHTRLFDHIYAGQKNFAAMRKYYNAYITAFPEAKGLRSRLMETQSVRDVERVVEQYRAQALTDCGKELTRQ